MATFPRDVGIGTGGGPVWRTEVVVRRDGQERRNVAFSEPDWTFRVVYSGGFSKAFMDDLRAFQRAHQGMFSPFRFRDWLDYQLDDEEIGPGDGAETVFQLKKTFSAGGRTFVERVTRPVSGTLSITVNGAGQTEGVDYTVDYDTGAVTFSSPPTSGHSILATTDFDKWVRLDEDSILPTLDAYEVESLTDTGMRSVREDAISEWEWPTGGAGTPSGRLPVGDWASSGGPGYQTLVERIANGQESRTALWEDSRGTFLVEFQVRQTADLQTLLAWFLTHRGRAYPFRFKDWSDYVAEDEALSGSGTSWQLQKTYTAGAYSYARTIRKPVSGTVTLADGGTPLDPADYTVDYDTGAVVTTSPPGGTLTWSGEFDLWCRFDSDDFSLVLSGYGVGSVESVTLREVAA